MTSKAHQDTPTAGANLTFARGGLSLDVFYSLIDEFQTTVIPASTEVGVTTTYVNVPSYQFSPTD